MSEVQNKGTILIVDDEPDVLFFISKVCQPQGYLTITAGSGLEAIKLIEDLKGKIDLVLLDLKMPGMGGIEVLRSIRKYHDNLPVIILTALQDKRSECEKLDVEAYITKPYSLEELYKHITAVIGRRDEEKETVEVPEGKIPSAKVLVVDDETEVCEILSDCLSNDVIGAKYNVKFVTSGDAALRFANEFEPDIAIIDIKMPLMWGDELIERFKRGEAYCPKDFIIFTSADIPEQKKKAKKAGHKYLTKPNQIEDLAEVLKGICVRHGLLTKK